MDVVVRLERGRACLTCRLCVLCYHCYCVAACALLRFVLLAAAVSRVCRPMAALDLESLLCSGLWALGISVRFDAMLSMHAHMCATMFKNVVCVRGCIKIKIHWTTRDAKCDSISISQLDAELTQFAICANIARCIMLFMHRSAILFFGFCILRKGSFSSLR